MEEVVRWAVAQQQKKDKNKDGATKTTDAADDVDDELAAAAAAAALRRRKTKIICTLGPRTRDVPTLERLLRAGMNVARFNFSHGSHDYHRQTLDNLRAAMHNTQLMCAVMLDTKGPEIRTGLLKDGKAIQLREGQEITIFTYGGAAAAEPPVGGVSADGKTTSISMSYRPLATSVAPGSTILCSDGTITLTVLSCDPAKGAVRCRCENTAVLGEKKNVNLPGVVVDLPTLTDKDRDDILNWAIPNRIDFIAASFVRKPDDVLHLRQLLGSHAKSIHIISKIENQEGLVNFDDILRETDGVMVARGDLGMEIPIEKIFLAQKMMIYKCNAVGKPVVTATQMLESMIKSPKPTRAEATDVANAVVDGTDAVMLSGETAAGAFPEEAVKVMARLCVEAESAMDHSHIMKQKMRSADSVSDAGPLESLACSAVRAAWTVRASLIMVLTRTGVAASLVAKYRPHVPIVSVVVPVITSDRLTWSLGEECPYRHSLICRGLIPILAEASTKGKDCDASDEILSSAIAQVLEMGLCRHGDAVVALHRIGASSVIKIVNVKGSSNSTDKQPSPASP